MKSDGSVIIDTRVNTDGIDKAMSNLGNDMEKSVADVSKAGEKIGKDFSEGFETQLNVSERLNAFGESMSNVGNNLTNSLTKPLMGLGESMIVAASEMNALESQFTQVFGEFEGQAASSLGKIADDTGIVEERLKGTYTGIAAFAKTSGMETQDALNLTDRAMRAVADSAAFYDRSLEETAESLQSFLKGNYENDSALGLSATEYTRNAAAMELYGESFNKLSESQKQLTLLKMVEDANALSGALGQASRESDTWSNVTGNLNQEMTNLKATLGQSLLPVIQPIVEFLTKMMEKFGEMSPAMQNIIVGVGLLVAALGPLLSIVGSVVSIIGTLMPLLSGVTIAFNPIVLAVAAAAAAILILIANWEKVTEVMTKFDEFLQGVFATDFTEVFGPVLGESLNAFFANVKNIWESIKQIFNGIITFIKGVFSGDWEQAWNGIKDIFAGVWNLLVSVIKIPINNIIGMINGLVGGVVSGINMIIRALNGLNFTVPDWIPGIGGKSVGFSIAEISAQKIPYLATGAVIPPNAPFMAMLGDQRHGTNIEAPLDTIKQAVREVIGNGSGNNATYHFVAQLDGRTLFEEVINEARLRQAVTGKNIFEVL